MAFLPGKGKSILYRRNLLYGKAAGCSEEQEEQNMGELSKLPNIGKIVEEQLNQVGIYTEEQLARLGKQTGLAEDPEHRQLRLHQPVDGLGRGYTENKENGTAGRCKKRN